MRHSVSIQGSILAVVLCAVLAACGGAGKSTSGNGGGGGGGGNVTMQAGQWEFVITPSNGAAPFYVEANLTDSGNGVFASVSNTNLYQPQTIVGGSIGTGFCGNFTFNGDISGNALTGNLNGGAIQNATFSAVVGANGQSVSGGSYTGGSCDFDSGTTTGTFTGYVVAPLSGTFAGTLTSNIYGPDQVTVSITQSANFEITVSGTSLENAVTTTLSISSGCVFSSNECAVIGAIVDYSPGTATNVNGSSTFAADGHFNATGTQLTIRVSDSSTGELTTGTLRKQ
jgi:hypothetical protein